MAQCVTQPTATLYGQSTITGAPRYSTSIRESVETVVEPASFSLASACQGGGVPDVSATTENPTCSTWSFPVVTTRTVTSTFTDITTLDGTGPPVVTSFPTETQYKTSCGNNPPKETTQTTVAFVPTTVYSLQVSSTEVPITVANGEVSVSLILQTVSVLLAATATVTQNVTQVAPTSSSTPVGVIAGAAAGGAIALTAIAVGLLFFMRRKKRRRAVVPSDEDEDGRYGAIGADGFASGKGAGDKKQRVNLVDSDTNGSNSGVVEPFTYTSPSISAAPFFEPLPQQTFSPPSSSSSQPQIVSSPPISPSGSTQGGHSSLTNPYFSPSTSPPLPGSPPATTSSRENKASEAQRRRPMGPNASPGIASGSNRSSSMNSHGWAGGGTRFDDDTSRSPGEEQPEPILVHRDAGPVRELEELPPVYANRGGEAA